MVCDKKNDTSNTYTVPVGTTESNDEYCYCFRVENIKILPGDYTVSIASQKIANFVSEGNQVEYFIALEP